MKTKVKLETEKEVTLNDISALHHIGFIDGDGDKGYSSTIEHGQKVILHQAKGIQFGEYLADSIQDAIENSDVHPSAKIKELYIFTTRKELYQWLAE